MNFPLLLIASGFLGFNLVYFTQQKIDRGFASLFSFLQTVIRKWRGPKTDPYPEIFVLRLLIGGLRAGQSLDSIIENTLQKNLPMKLKRRLELVCHRNPEPDSLSQILFNSLTYGGSIIQPLQSLLRLFSQERKITLRISAMSAQARAQAEVLSYLPILLGLGIALISHDSISQAKSSSISWFLWSLSLFLIAVGKFWVASSMKKVFRAQSTMQEIEFFQLPQLIFQLIGQISSGRDPLSSFEEILSQPSLEMIRHSYLEASAEKSIKLENLVAILSNASLAGGSIKEELFQLLQEIHSELESSWEERVQTLPVKLLAPLFCCFLPSTLICILAFIWPQLEASL